MAGESISSEFALGKYHPETHFEFGGNRNPHLAWEGVPGGAKSLVILCVDSDAPTKPDDVNQEGHTVPLNLERADFYHWLLVDVPAADGSIVAGQVSDGVTPKGKRQPIGWGGGRRGLNDYTGWFSGDVGMEGKYLGYDGPAPPWNDERVHRYHFEVYALDVEQLNVGGEFTGPDVRAAMEGHVLAAGCVSCTYAIYPNAVLP